MNLPEVTSATIHNHKARLWIDPGNEAIHLVDAIWWLEELSVKIKLCERIITLLAGDNHLVVFKPKGMKVQYSKKVPQILGNPIPSPIDFYHTMSDFNIIVWNCRGAGNDRFKRNFLDIFNAHKPDIVGLLETKVSLSTMGSFFINLGLTESVSVDPLGRSGGVWVLWDPKKVSVTTIKMNTQVIHVNVKKNNFQDWVLSTVYASPLPRNRDVLWEDLIETAESINEPWTVIGDLNDTASYDEVKSFAADSNAGQRRKFSDNINKCKLVDMGSSGNKFTWNNGRQGLANVQKRLDRGLCNEEWRALFPEGVMKLNSDGCWYKPNKAAGFGGIFRDDKGSWCFGYYGKLFCTSSLEAELWGIYRGLAIILEKGLSNVKIESDALVAVNLINNGANANHPLSTIIHDAKTILNGTNSSLAHTYRSANECADHLARIGAEQEEDFKFLPTSPPSMREFYIRDSLNIRQILD